MVERLQNGAAVRERAETVQPHGIKTLEDVAWLWQRTTCAFAGRVAYPAVSTGDTTVIVQAPLAQIGYGSSELRHYAEVCGWVLARAHAKTGDAAMISGYLGKSDRFEEAIGDFADAYANQNKRDHAVLAASVNAGQIETFIEDML